MHHQNNGFIASLVSMVALAFCFSISEAAVSLPWHTTYNCPDWHTSLGFQTGCDGIVKDLDGKSSGGHEEQIAAEANYSGGGGGKGQRHWIGPKNFFDSDPTIMKNDGSGGTWLILDKDYPETWLRWYMRFQQGFPVGDRADYKSIYYNGSGHDVPYMPHGVDGLSYYNGSGDGEHHACGSCGFRSINGNPSDGTWHCYEVHLKRQSPSTATNGIIQIWVDGKLKIDDQATRTAPVMNAIEISSNMQNNYYDRPDMYIDYDDIVFTNSTPSNRDAQGNPMIGPIASTNIATARPGLGAFGISPVVQWCGTGFAVQLAKPGDFALKVLDISGREVWQYHSERATAGSHQISWNNGKKITGMFFVSLKQGDKHVQQKFLAMK